MADSISGPAVVIPNGVPDRPQAALEAPTVVMLQRLEAEKAPELGIWPPSPRADWAAEGWRLVIAGTGALQTGARTQGRGAGRRGQHGVRRSGGRHRPAAGRASVFLAPGHLDEPFGLSVVEAMAHGVPVVAAAGGAHRETVGEDGLLFPPGDAPAAGAALARLGGDPGLRHTVGARPAPTSAVALLAPPARRRLEEVYREVAGSGGNGPHAQMAAPVPVP